MLYKGSVLFKEIAFNFLTLLSNFFPQSGTLVTIIVDYTVYVICEELLFFYLLLLLLYNFFLNDS